MPDAQHDPDKSLLDEVNDRLRKMALDMERGRMGDYVQLTNRPFKLMGISFIHGIFRGAGMAVGFALIGGTLVYALQQLGSLDIPIIGNYIAKIVEFVQAELSVR